MRLDIRHYEILVAIERTASISGAARERGTGQAGISRTLRRIEAALGVVIFERDSHGVRPTAAGRDVLATARAALDAAARPATGPGTPRLRVLLALSCSDFLAPLYELRPALDVVTSNVSPEPGFAALVAGEADVLVGVQTPHNPWPRHHAISEIAVGSEQFRVAVPATHPLAGNDIIDLGDLATEDWIVEDDPALVRFLVGECRELGGFEPRIRYRTNEGTKALLLEGAGVKLVSELMELYPHCVVRPYRGASPIREYVCHVEGALPWPMIADVVTAVRRSNELLDEEALKIRAASRAAESGPEQL